LRALWVALLLFILASPSLGAPYDTQMIVAAQEALTRLGYDVGTADGKWGAKSRKALNEVRANNGLPPADTFTGSSLELLHRLSPGSTTLPHPGVLIVDPVERQAFIKLPKNFNDSLKWCAGKLDEVGDLRELLKQTPIGVVSTSSGPKGYISRGDDFYTPIMQIVIGAHNTCLQGRVSSCRQIVDLMSAWTEADALRPGAKRTDRRFDDISWIANSLLRNFTFAYADARKLADVDAKVDAAIVDWLKRRIDEYHYLKTSGEDPFSPDYWEAGNHALADMMAAMAFGAMVGDRPMMEPAFETWREVLRVMRDDGSLPNETKRGARALHYSNFQIGQLLATAEVARVQGIDPAGEEASSGRTIQKAVTFLLDAYENFDTVRPYAKANSGAGPSDDHTIQFFRPAHLGWLPAYLARFGDDANVERMRTLTMDGRICSAKAQDEDKVSRSDRVCPGSTGEPLPLVDVLTKSGGNVGEEAFVYMGYSAQCLQGTTRSWAIVP
jgi:hypothetical protein